MQRPTPGSQAEHRHECSKFNPGISHPLPSPRGTDPESTFIAGAFTRSDGLGPSSSSITTSPTPPGPVQFEAPPVPSGDQQGLSRSARRGRRSNSGTWLSFGPGDGGSSCPQHDHRRRVCVPIKPPDSLLPPGLPWKRALRSASLMGRPPSSGDFREPGQPDSLPIQDLHGQTAVCLFAYT